MNQEFKNDTGISILVAAWLAHDDYDGYKPEGVDKYLSVTTLIKPLREIVLSFRLPERIEPVDVSTLVDSRIGQAIHSAIENLWLDEDKRNAALRKLGYDDTFISSININDDSSDIDTFDLQLENRVEKVINGWTISGKYDAVIEGSVEDNKIKKTFAFSQKSTADEFLLQASIYRLLNPNIIRHDNFRTNWIFKDHSASSAKKYPDNYPSHAAISHEKELMSLEETQEYIEDRLELIDYFMDMDQDDIPQCTDEELWRDAPTYKLYKDPAKRARSTKNSNSYDELVQYRAEKLNGVGLIVEVPDKAKRCAWCSVADICEQRERMQASGDLA